MTSTPKCPRDCIICITGFFEISIRYPAFAIPAKKRLPPGEDEYEAAIGFLDAFVDDSMALAEASCLEPAKIALVHSPAFFDTVMVH